jgi:hypothetical protein
MYAALERVARCQIAIWLWGAFRFIVSQLVVYQAEIYKPRLDAHASCFPCLNSGILLKDRARWSRARPVADAGPLVARGCPEGFTWGGVTS